MWWDDLDYFVHLVKGDMMKKLMGLFWDYFGIILGLFSGK
jgi:hypothetical protein